MNQLNNQFINSLFVRVLGVDESLDKEKPKLVFLHGLLGNGQNWLPIARELEKNFTILLIDQRGHGKSHHPESYHPRDFAKDLKEVLDILGWSKVSAVGHSLGARVLFYFAKEHGEYLDSLVIEDMGPHKTGSASNKTEEMVKFVPVPFVSRKEAKSFFDGEFKSKYGDVLAGYLYANLEKFDGERLRWRFSLDGILKCIQIGHEEDFWKEYKTIECNTLLIRGERSEHLPLNIYQEMLRENTKVQGVEIPDSGHWVHFDQKEAFLKELKSFFKT